MLHGILSVNLMVKNVIYFKRGIKIMFGILTDVCAYQIENNTLLCSANQWSGFCMIRTSVMNELMNIKKLYLYEMLY